MGLLKQIEWVDNSKDTLVYKLDIKNDYVAKGSVLTVRDSQVCVFATKGKMADVFLPGYYKLDTDSIPFITKLMSWKYGFENPFRSDIYFVSTKQFTNEKWGTQNPLYVRDKDYGAIEVRGFGTYSFRVKDAFVFLQELSGTGKGFTKNDITEYLRSILIMGVSDSLAQSKIPLLDMAANLLELSEATKAQVQSRFSKLGVELAEFNFMNVSMPEEYQKAFRENAALNMRRGSIDVYAQISQLDALKTAAGNPGSGNMMGAAMGMGMAYPMGHAMGAQMSQAFNNPPTAAGVKIRCSCGALVDEKAKFCPECGKAQSLVCKDCGTILSPGAKFCPDCGKKV
ncbi:MAG: SPFH domain-containing protein [Christensenellaceae bacterium]|jgi:membrane protease subunit (stomatin/prohibitin family)|nr:SPFH domain-containing protein [Christensenellaceae bacterium]